MRFYAGFTDLLCSPQAVLKRSSWPKDKKVILMNKRISRTGGDCSNISIEDFNANDWELVVPEENDKN